MSTHLTSGYDGYIGQLQDCQTACTDTLAATNGDEACHHSLSQCAAALRDAVAAMQTHADYAGRALVDAADACELVADRCGEATNETARQTAELCRTTVDVCRRASLVGVD